MSSVEQPRRRTAIREILAAGLERLDERDRMVLAKRFPREGDGSTLEAIARDFRVSRERIRQIVARATKRIGEARHLRVTLLAKLGVALADRRQPAFLEMLDTEDHWFRGIDDNPSLTGHLIRTWSVNTLHVWRWDVRHIVTRLSERNWKALCRESTDIVAGFGSSRLTRQDVSLLVNATARQKGAGDLAQGLVRIVNESAQYGFDPDSSEEVLLGLGRDYKTILRVILFEAPAPLAMPAICERYRARVGLNGRSLKTVTSGLRNALRQPDVYQFSRRRYGSRRHFNLTQAQGRELRRAAEDLLTTDPNRQWHCSEMVRSLSDRLRFPKSGIDEYTVEAFLRDSKKVISLNRLVWAIRGSPAAEQERRNIDDLAVEALVRAGSPLSTGRLRKAIRAVRGVRSTLQIVPSNRLIALGRGRWGLRGRDGDSKNTEADNDHDT